MTTTALSLADLIYLAAAIVAVGGGALGLYRGAMKIYRQTAGSRRDLARRLNQLGAGVTVRWVEERFGTPAFARAFAPAGDGQVAGLAPMRELVYRSRHAWLQILANEHDAVVRFSVTITDPRFGFQVEHLTNGQLKVRLGRGSFAEIKAWGEPGGRNLRIGAHNREYAEAYWFGNPGNYQWYVVSHNDAGTGAFRFSLERDGPAWVREGVLKFGDPPVEVRPFDPGASYALKFKAGTIVNTLTVLGPLQKTEVLTEPRGPDSNQVRVLVPGVRQRWKIRRRIRRLIRQAETSASAPDTLSGIPESDNSGLQGPEGGRPVHEELRSMNVALLTVVVSAAGVVVTVAIPVVRWWNSRPRNLSGQRRIRVLSSQEAAGAPGPASCRGPDSVPSAVSPGSGPGACNAAASALSTSEICSRYMSAAALMSATAGPPAAIAVRNMAQMRGPLG